MDSKNNQDRCCDNRTTLRGNVDEFEFKYIPEKVDDSHGHATHPTSSQSSSTTSTTNKTPSEAEKHFMNTAGSGSESDKGIDNLLQYNKNWAEKINLEDPTFFQRLSKSQNPKYLWIGCSDSRVPAETLTGLGPGDLFVHRNVANQIIHTDLNALSVIQYAVDVLKVQNIIVCGHYKCGGVKAAIENPKLGLINNWLLHIRDLYLRYRVQLDKIKDFDEKVDKLCEINIAQQLYNIGNSTILQNAWARGQQISIQAWVYSLENGMITELDYAASSREVFEEVNVNAIQTILNGIQNLSSYSDFVRAKRTSSIYIARSSSSNPFDSMF